MPVSVKKMGWSTSEDGKARAGIQEEEGAGMSEQKQGEAYKVKTKKEVRHVEKKSYS